MYLAVTFLRAGFSVQCPKPGPDIQLTINGKKIWIEAVCSSPGEQGKPDSVPELKSDPMVFRERPNKEMVLRISSSLHEKQTKFQRWISDGVIGPEDLTVIAINTHDIYWARVDIDALMPRALYGLGDIVSPIDRTSQKTVGQRHAREPILKKTGTGSPISVTPFKDGSLSHISAVLGSWEDAYNRTKNLGEELILYPNISAKNKWQSGILNMGEEWELRQSENGDDHLSKVKHQFTYTPPPPD